jgi:hypothetical protein
MTQTLLDTWQDSLPFVKSTNPLATGDGVIDESAFNTIEVDKLFDAVNYASTTIGQAVLYRSLCQPLASSEAIRAKQNAVKELIDNTELKTSLEGIIDNAVVHEKNFYLLLFGKFLGSFSTAREDYEIEGYGYIQYIRAMRFLPELLAEIQALPTPQSPYLANIFDTIKSFASTKAFSLMEGPAYLTEQGIFCKQERAGSLIPAIIFKPRIFKPVLLSIVIAMLLAIKQFLPISILHSIPSETIFLSPFLLLYFPLVGGFDRDHCMIPLANIYKNSKSVAKTLDAIGQLDELLSLIKLSTEFGCDMVLPEIIDGEHHKISLTNAKNPVLARENKAYVGNDFVLEDDKLVLITGPNSGGKTAFCKTVTQIQLLAQIGSFVPAKAAKLTVADKIFYQVSEVSHLNDGEGRFGTELKRTKDIFLATTAKSLVVLDELSEGTTFEEKMESSTNVLNGFYRKGNSTILITHNHQLVDNFARNHIGIPKQVEFTNEAPSYRLIEGISRVSHADRVAKKIGFSKEDIEHYLEDKK